MTTIYRKRTNRRRIVLAFLVVASVALITVDFRSGLELSAARKVLLEVVQPVQSVVDSVVGPVGDFFGNLFDTGELKRENEALRQENAELLEEKVRTTKLEKENRELTELTNLQNPLDFDFVTVRIIGAPATNFDNSVFIDSGKTAGVSDGNPVVSGEGLVGRVVDTTSRGAKMLLLSDPSSSVAVRTVRSGVAGVVSGNGDGALSLEYVDSNADVLPGDVFVTSGFDGSRYPAGLPVGIAGKVVKAESGLALDVELVPSADSRRSDFISVLLWTPPE